MKSRVEALEYLPTKPKIVLDILLLIVYSEHTEATTESLEMSTITIKLVPVELIREFFYVDNIESVAKRYYNHYEVCPSFELNCEDRDPAEDAYDLTNNPSRQRRREELYGRGRSVSIGDIVNVDGKDFLCDRIGFIKMSMGV